MKVLVLCAASVAAAVAVLASTPLQSGRGDDRGRVTSITRGVPVEIHEAASLSDSGPSSIRCDDGAVILSCTAVPDHDVIPRLKADERLYGRTVYRSITKEVTDRGEPVFESDELVCRANATPAKMTCSRVDRVQPVIESRETTFVTYRPYNVTFNEQGGTVGHAGRVSVPLVRETP